MAWIRGHWVWRQRSSS
ncbi:MAG: BcpO-related WXXGXW repeat protein [Synechococcaceae cyanobacterium SM2_3_1]|nr:BcpO-related WXXGXW repeat protein [Synechococcaceae cyanobacterium SM2_3_1]